ELDVTTGKIKAPTVFKPDVMAAYSHVLSLFSPATNYNAGLSPASVAIGDFNNDTFSDLAVANNNNSNNVSILLGDGKGSFGTATNYSAGSFSRSVAVGDFNKDTFPDLVVTNNDSNSVSILLGDGTGSFGTATSYSAGSNPSSVAIGNFNHDNFPDLVVTNRYYKSVSILLGDGTGSFGTPSNYSAGSNPSSVAIGDFNNDTFLDLVVTDYFSNSVSILLGDGTGSFGTATNYSAGSFSRSVAVGDFNNDTSLDLVVTSGIIGNSNNVSILLGNGTGSFGTATNYSAGYYPNSVAVGDFNHDTFPDLVVTDDYSNRVSILLGDGTGSFGVATNYGGESNSHSVAVGDFNNDTFSDLAVANIDSDNISILLGSTSVDVNFGTPTYRENEATQDTAINIPVTLSKSPLIDVTVPIVINPNSTATQGADQDYTLSTTVKFPAGASGTALTQNIAVTIKPDNIPENDETVILGFGPIAGAVVGTIPETTLTIGKPAPSFEWLKQFGTPNDDRFNRAALDSAGNVYLTGDTYDPLGGTNPSTNAWVAKYDSSGSQLWLKQLENGNYPSKVTVNSAGNVYLTGQTSGDLGGPNAGGLDTWATKYDSNGNQLWLKQFGTADSDSPSDLALDSDGNLYISGTSTTGTLGSGSRGSVRPWVAKYDDSGNQLWLKNVNADGDSSSYGIKVDSSGNVYLTGTSSKFGVYALKTWAANYDSNGNQLWLKQFETADSDSPAELAVDSAGNLYLTGSTNGALGSPKADSQDIWVAKYDSNGNQLWLKQFGTADSDSPSDLALDSVGNVYLTGENYNSSKGYPAGVGTWAAKYDSNGNQLWLKQFGNAESEYRSNLAVDSAGNVYLTGQTNTAFGGTNAGGLDIWATKYDSNGNQLWLKQFGTANSDSSSELALDSDGNVYLAGETNGALGGTNAGGQDIWVAKLGTIAEVVTPTPTPTTTPTPSVTPTPTPTTTPTPSVTPTPTPTSTPTPFVTPTPNPTSTPTPSVTPTPTQNSSPIIGTDG
ncbi:SBBP repeat-containing protein, partial [Microcoleus sp. S28C3]|uniref:SBBP repeat-containing protein n=1 Tax=Microcoleus sp. S28C3 TaxID=3055414 RepID=UPI002FD0F567